MSLSGAAFPHELFHEIAPHVEDTPTIASLCLASHAWNAASTKYLYQRDVDIIFRFTKGSLLGIDKSKPLQLARTVQARPELAAHITGVTISIVQHDNNLPYRTNNPVIRVDTGPAKEALKTILEAGTSIVAFAVEVVAADDFWAQEVTLACLTELLSCTSRLKGLQRLKVDYCTNAIERAQLFLATPSLLHLDFQNLEFYLPFYPTLPTSSLRSLILRNDFHNRDAHALASTPSRTSLQSVEFCASVDDPPSWDLFPNLKTVTVFNNNQERGQTATSLATCVAAESITLRLQYRGYGSTTLATTRTLHSLPPSLVSLDLSPITQGLTQYVLDWLRDGESPNLQIRTGEWPNLRKVKMNWVSPQKTRRRLPQRLQEQHEERKQLRLACEEVCKRRGVELEWTE